MAEEVVQCNTIEQARNQAVQWLEARNVSFGPQRTVIQGNLKKCEELFGKETGVSGNTPGFWRLRLDHDPLKGLHFNAEFGKGGGGEKAAFCFPGGADLLRKLANARRPR